MSYSFVPSKDSVCDILLNEWSVNVLDVFVTLAGKVIAGR